MSACDNFLAVYQQLDGNNLKRLASIYAEDILFVDPAHRIEGLEQLTAYFAHLYANISEISFDFSPPKEAGTATLVEWTMNFAHPRLNSGKNISVDGISVLHFNPAGLVCYHRDYFDLGAMLYEQLPLLGRVIRKIKERMGG